MSIALIGYCKIGLFMLNLFCNLIWTNIFHEIKEDFTTNGLTLLSCHVFECVEKFFHKHFQKQNTV